MVNTDLITGLVFGIVGTMIIGTIMLVFIMLFVMLHKLKFNRLIRVKNITAGQPKVEWYKGRLIKHKTLGDCYEIPKLRKEQRQFIPFFGSTYEYPTQKAKLMYVPVTFYQNVYSPEKYEYKEEIEIETIQKNNKTGKYEKIIKKTVQSMINPLKSSMRQFNLAADKVIEEEFNLPIGWFERNKAIILSFAIVFIAAVVAVIMIVFAYQAGADGVYAQTPEWARSILDAVTANQAPPPSGGAS